MLYNQYACWLDQKHKKNEKTNSLSLGSRIRYDISYYGDMLLNKHPSSCLLDLHRYNRSFDTYRLVNWPPNDPTDDNNDNE